VILARSAVLERDKDTGHMKEKDLHLNLEPEFIPHIDSLENLEDQQDLQNYAQKHSLNCQRLALYRDIFNMFDDGTFECVVTV